MLLYEHTTIFPPVACRYPFVVCLFFILQHSKQCCNKHFGTQFIMCVRKVSPKKLSRNEISGLKSMDAFSPLFCWIALPSTCTNLQHSCCPPPLPKFDIVRLKHFCPYEKCKAISHWFFFFNVYTHGIWKFLGQGLDPSCSCDLQCSCSNTSPLSHCAGPGMKVAPPQRP